MFLLSRLRGPVGVSGSKSHVTQVCPMNRIISAKSPPSPTALAHFVRDSASKNTVKGEITSKIKLAIIHKRSPARLAQLLQSSLAFCFSLQPMTADGTPSLAGS